MFFLRQIWNTFFPKTVNDPEFGTLTLDWIPDFLGNGGPEGLWIGKAVFVPLGRSSGIMFMMESDSGASPYQRELYHSVAARWSNIRDELAKRLVERIHEWYGVASGAGMPPTEQFFQNWVCLDNVSIRSSSRRLRDIVDVDLDFSLLPGALTNPSLLKTQDHYLSAQLVDGEVVGAEWH